MMQTAIPCSGSHCLRPACSVSSDNKPVCFFHAACSDSEVVERKKMQLNFTDIAIAQKQAKEFKLMASQVWDEIVEELEEAGEQKRKLEKSTSSSSLQKVNTAPSISPSPQSSSSKRPKRENILHISDEEDGNKYNSVKSIFSRNIRGVPCKFCGKEDNVTYETISSSIDASKADTWGSSNRPDRILRFTCHVCNQDWIVEEG